MEKKPTRRKKQMRFDSRISLRMPSRLEEELTKRAHLEGRSLNGQILYLLAQAINRPDLLA
jgi:hypothetical protein